MGFKRAVVLVMGLTLVAAGCVPGTGPAPTDTLDLGPLGVFSEPGLTITAGTSEDYSPQGPRSTVLTVVARDAEGNIVKSFTMREDNVSGAIVPPKPGDFPGIFAPPHTRQFTVSGGPGSTEASTLFGDVNISEITRGEEMPGVNGPSYEVTHLRASFSGIYASHGQVSGYFTVG
jgi:hypothetical protein